MMYKLTAAIIITFLAIFVVGGIYAVYDQYQLIDKICQKKYKDKDDYDYCMGTRHIIVDNIPEEI